MKNKQGLKKLLLKQYELYPKIQLQDMVKLIYQNEFAGGHMIGDEGESLERLKEEYMTLEGLPHIGLQSSGYEWIGNRLCRLNLRGLLDCEIDIETVNRFFIDTANSIEGDISSFECKLDILRECCIEGSLPFCVGDLDAYISEYRAQGYPPVSHSEIYRETYYPAYRIVKAEYCHYFQVFEAIDALLREGGRINVAIDGNAGAGKSTLADLLARIYDCNIFHMDDFFLRAEQRTRERLEEVGGNVDYIRFKQEVVQGIKSGCGFEYRPYNCQRMALEDPISIEPKPLNIIEGVYSMHPTLIDDYDLKIFLQVDEREQAKRILKRNGPKMQRRFLDEWIPLENEYFRKLCIESKSDLVFKTYF